MDDYSEVLKIVLPIVGAVLIIVILCIIAAIIGKKTGIGFFKALANIFWLVFIGWIAALLYWIVGAICCVTIIFIPVGIQYFKLGRLAFWPFGYKPTFTKLSGFKMFVNILWMIFGGWESAVVHFVLGGLCCITVVLIPCGLQLFKFGRLVLMPLGTTIEKAVE